MFMGTTPFIMVRASRPLSEIEFCAWVAQAVPGDRLEYHRGFLVLDIFPVFSGLWLISTQEISPPSAPTWSAISAQSRASKRRRISARVPGRRVLAVD